jgi:hypothetical protein
VQYNIKKEPGNVLTSSQPSPRPSTRPQTGSSIDAQQAGLYRSTSLDYAAADLLQMDPLLSIKQNKHTYSLINLTDFKPNTSDYGFP